MSIFVDCDGNVNSIFILFLLIPIFLLLIFTINESSLIFKSSVSDTSSFELSDSSDDFIDHIDIVAKESLSNLSYMVCKNGCVFANASFEIRRNMSESLSLLANDYYYDRGIVVDCSIVDVAPSDNPFYVDVYYSLNSSLVNSSKSYHKSGVLSVSIVDDNYPVYDPYSNRH